VIQLSLFVLLLVALALCFACNRDLCSPSKFYHAFLCVFFIDIFRSEHAGCVYAIYLAFILAGMLLSLTEAFIVMRKPKIERPTPSLALPARFVMVLWLLSALPILSEAYLVHITGGLASLTRVIAHRVVEWQGLGPLTVLIKMVAPINLVYFAMGLVYGKRYAALWWLAYLVHLLLFILIGLLQGSRGFVLMHFLFMAVVYHYLRKPLKLRYALIGGTLLLVVGAFLGTVRNNLSSLRSVESLNSMRGDTLNLAIFAYGTKALDCVFAREFSDLQYGKTFFTPVTNFVPRRIWPGKFDPGGVVLTRFTKGYSYTGLSNTSPGLIAEGILNFGYPVGVAAGFMLLLAGIVAIARFYRWFRECVGRRGDLSAVSLVIVHAYGSTLVGGLLFGEFQSQVGAFLIRLVLLSLVVLSLRMRLFFLPTSRIVAIPVS
jgi:oligosaccharide repeat unit polymerase